MQAVRQPPNVSRDELLIRKAISDDCLHEHEKGYEHLPEVDDEDIRAAEERLDEFGDDWFDSDAGIEAYNTFQQVVHQKQAEQFANTFASTLPSDVAQRRSDLISNIKNVLTKCRKCEHWDDRSEYKLPSWLDHVPEKMIPYTSIPNLLRILDSVSELLRRHQNLTPLPEKAI